MEFSVACLERYLPAIFPAEWTLVDCGAFEGSFTEDLLAMRAPTRAIIVEANPGQIPLLTRKFQTTSLTQFHILNNALSDKAGTMTFNLYEDAATNSLLDAVSPDDKELKSKRIDVSAITLNHVVKDCKGPVLLKTDLQGSDLTALKAAPDFIREHVTVCVIEFIEHDLYRHQGKTLEIWNYMDGLGFNLFQLADLHSFQSGRISFGNLVFVKKSLMPVIEAAEKDVSMVANETISPLTRLFKEAADERLALIHRLDAELKLVSPAGQRTFFEKVVRRLKR